MTFNLFCFFSDFQYGVSLKAEPDHKTLGFRLKGAFKDVMKEIKLLTDDQLTDFVKTGSMKVKDYKIVHNVMRYYLARSTKLLKANSLD